MRHLTDHRALQTALAAVPDAWDIPNIDHDRVDYWVRRFITDKRSDFEAYLARSGRCAPMI